MQNQNQPPQPNVPETNRLQHVQAGLELAQQTMGFDLSISLAANYGSGREHEANSSDEVIHTMAAIAEGAELDDSFYLRPFNTIFLAAVADSLVDNERRAQTGSHDSKIATEREMLSDLMLALAGRQSGVVRDMMEKSPREADRYVNMQTEQDPDDIERAAFTERINDVELAAQVKAILKQDGQGTFLEAVRAQLGTTAETERPYEVRVLKVAASPGEYVSLAHFDPIVRPNREDYGKDTEGFRAYLDASDVCDREAQRRRDEAREYVSAYEEYEQRFADKFGRLPQGYVELMPDGSKVLTIQFGLARDLVDSWGPSPKLQRDDPSIQASLVTIRHEAGHTDKDLQAGEKMDIGSILEEQKGVRAGGKVNLGYLDLEWMLQELGFATGSDLFEQLDVATRSEDPLSTFAANTSGQIGLRSLLMLLASKPIGYSEFSELTGGFESLSCIRTERDMSNQDAIIRETVTRRGDTNFAANIGTYVSSLVLAGKPEENLRSSLGMRSSPKWGGLGFSAPYFEAAVIEAYARRTDQTP